MNSVSWFIYIAQVSNSTGQMFVALGIIGLVACALYTLIATTVASVDADDFNLRCPQARYFAGAITFLLIGNLMPARDTMFAIAASQVGEKIINSETVRGVADDATKALQQWIKKQIDPEKSK